jgi:hypothetical protein
MSIRKPPHALAAIFFIGSVAVALAMTVSACSNEVSVDCTVFDGDRDACGAEGACVYLLDSRCSLSCYVQEDVCPEGYSCRDMEADPGEITAIVVTRACIEDEGS